MKKNVILTIMMASMAAAPSFALISTRKEAVESKAYDLGILNILTDQTVEMKTAMNDKIAELDQIQDPDDKRSIQDLDNEIQTIKTFLGV